MPEILFIVIPRLIILLLINFVNSKFITDWKVVFFFS